ncbi:MAG: radical SAM protein, partial [Bacillota bacterium]|nr:radical SAM protein [Bacillota bacterium]
MFHLVYADKQGRLYQDPELAALGRSGEEYWPLGAADLIPLPPGAEVAVLPGRSPLGVDRRGRAAVVSSEGRQPLWAVGALLPPGYLRLALPAWEKEEGAPPLGLFGYTALAGRKNRLYVAALPLDPDPRWDPRHYNLPGLAELVAQRRRASPSNRLLAHLAHCAEVYHCYTAQNLFYRRWEAGIPVSPACNAGCLACISFQEAECCPAPQKRLEFVPTPEEVEELMEPHLAGAPEAIVSFGQGCEGEPLLQAELLEEVIGRVRRRTARGSINLNSNGGDPQVVERLCRAGLNCLRVSLFSARPALYDLYHRPRGYGVPEVR